MRSLGKEGPVVQAVEHRIQTERQGPGGEEAADGGGRWLLGASGPAENWALPLG